jgi:cytochrome o ubiquinol oxidase subunit 2
MRGARVGFPSLRRPARPKAAIARFGVLVAAVSLSGCDWAVLDPKGPIGDGNATLLVDSVAIMLVIVVPTIVATLGVAWWFRSSNQRAFYLPDWEYSGQLELIVWAIPLLTIMLLGGVTWIGSYDLDPARPIVSKEQPLNVQVVSLDWKWLFIYPDQHVASVNRLVIPAGTPIRFALTSGSVMTAFFVPQLGSMIYTMNRMRTQLYLKADEPGVFRGLATQISGDGFADMHFEVEAKSPQDFYAWLGQVRAGGPALTPESYVELSKQSVVPQPFTFQSVSDGLFEKILDQTLPPGPGPVAETDPGQIVATTSPLCVGRRN